MADDRTTAWTAHLGGLVAGLLLVIPFRMRGVLLFGREDDE